MSFERFNLAQIPCLKHNADGDTPMFGFPPQDDSAALAAYAARIVSRNRTEDFVDFARISDRIGAAETSKALENFDATQPQPDGESAIEKLIAKLKAPDPDDRGDAKISDHRWPTGFPDWDRVTTICDQSVNDIVCKSDLDRHCIWTATYQRGLREAAAAILKQNRLEDYVNFAREADRLGEVASADALRGFDDRNPLPEGGSAIYALMTKLAWPSPCDFEARKGVEADYPDGAIRHWQLIEDICLANAREIFSRVQTAEFSKSVSEAKVARRKQQRDRGINLEA